MNLLIKGEGVPLLNFVEGPGVPLLNFEGGPGVSLSNFRKILDPTFKLWGGPGSRVSRFRIPGSWFHFYTMPTSPAEQTPYPTNIYLNNDTSHFT